MALNFFNYFPPPKYLEMPAVGVDISDRSFKFAELKKNGSSLELMRYGNKALPEKIVESGEIKDKKRLSEFLKSNLKETGINFVISSLPEEKAFVSTVTLPKIPEEEIRGVLELQLEEHVPLPASEAVFDYEIIAGSRKSEHLDVVVVALPRGLIADYSEVFSLAGLTPIAFEMETQALARAVLPKGEGETCLIIDFGRTRTSFILVAEGEIRFASTVPVAGEALDKALAKSFGIDVFAAENMKKERGLVRTEEGKEIFNALLPVVSAIRDEISRHLSFWKSHAGHVHTANPEVRRIYLCGGDANLSGLPEYLSYELSVPVILANPWINITDFEKYIPEITSRESLSYATALGLALRDINV